jgi:LSD1 subclass zinc finger protein
MARLVAGLVLGFVVGGGLTYLLLPEDAPDEPVRREPERGREPSAAHAQGVPAQGLPEGHGAAGGDRAAASMAKAHFMKKFVAALVEKPQNRKPNPQWKSPLLDPAAPIDCRDCHDPRSFNIDRMRSADPGSEAVEPFRKDPAFMVPLMRKWVERLNRLHAERLHGVVTCTTCHEEDPSGADGERQERAMRYAYFMTTFLRALKEKPTTNREPAELWKPLLTEAGAQALRCSTCHAGTAIARMDGMMDARLPRPEAAARDKEFMVDLMEEWVTKLNREASEHLTKAVTCIDCHDRDPRR